MKRASLVCLFVCLAFLSVPEASAATFSAQILVNTKDEFSGTWSARVGYLPTDQGGTIAITGVLPGSRLYLDYTRPYSRVALYLSDDNLASPDSTIEHFLLVLDHREDVAWTGSYSLHGFQYQLRDWDYLNDGGINPGYDPNNPGHIRSDFLWAYWGGTFSIKRTVDDNPLPLPESGGSLVIFGVALGIVISARKLLIRNRSK